MVKGVLVDVERKGDRQRRGTVGCGARDAVTGDGQLRGRGGRRGVRGHGLHGRSTQPGRASPVRAVGPRSEEHTSELQSRGHLVCRLLLEKKKRRTERRNGGKV